MSQRSRPVRTPAPRPSCPTRRDPYAGYTISFMNDWRCWAELLGADIESVRKVSVPIRYRAYQFPIPGIGLRRIVFSERRTGGCQRTASAAGMELKLLEAVERVNYAAETMCSRRRSSSALAKISDGKTFALWVSR